jgi:4-amino-4-deoxy-L-arabinose transferase-like glycosyltransferase
LPDNSTPVFSEGTAATRDLVFLTALGGLLFFLDLGGRALWDIDEGMHAAIARTMLLSGDWVTPVFNGEAFFDKPPLVNWLTAAAFALFGTLEFAARLPSAIAGLGCVLLAYGIGRSLYSRRAGLLAGIVLATSLEFIILARVVQYDAPFTFFTTLALFAYVLLNVDASRWRRHVLLLHVATALAVLAKGPLGIVIVAVAILPHWLITRDPKLVRRVFDPVGIVLFLAIAVPWFLLMEQANPGYLGYFFESQIVGNVVGAAGGMAARHPEPFYYYAVVLVLALLPWSLMLPQSIYCVLEHREARGRALDVFVVASVVGTLALLSVAASKLANYVLPVLPPAAVLVGRYFDRMFASPIAVRKSSLIAVAAVGFLAFTGVAVYAGLQQSWSHWPQRTGVDPATFQLMLIVCGLLLLVAAGFAAAARQRANFTTLAFFAPFMVFFTLWILAPGSDPYRSAKGIAAAIDELLPEGEKLYFYGRLMDSAMFYTNRDAVFLRTEEEFRDAMAGDEQRIVIVRTASGRWEDIPDAGFHEILRIANKAIVSRQPPNERKLVSEQPDRSESPKRETE